MRTIYLILLAAVLLAFTGCGARKITVVHENWRPYDYEVDGRTVGLNREIVQGAADILGIQADFKAMPWEKCLEMAAGGDADAIISLSKTSERQDFLAYCDEELIMEEVVFFTRRGNKTAYDGTMESVSNLKIGAQEKYDCGDKFKNATFLKVDLSADLGELLQKVLDGKADLGVYDRVAVLDMLNEKGLTEKISIMEPAVNIDPLYIAFSTKTKAGGGRGLAADFSRALREFKKGPRYRALLKHYDIYIK